MPQGFRFAFASLAFVLLEAAPPVIPATVKNNIRQRVDYGYGIGVVAGLVNQDGRTVSAADTWFRVTIDLNPDNTYGLNVGHIDSNTGISGAEATETSSSFTRTGKRDSTGSGCIAEVESSTTTEKDGILLPPVMFFTGTRDSNSVA